MIFIKIKIKYYKISISGLDKHTGKMWGLYIQEIPNYIPKWWQAFYV